MPQSQIVFATYPPLPAPSNKTILWVGRLDYGIDPLSFTTGSPMRSQPRRVEVTLRMQSGAHETLVVYDGSLVRPPMVSTQYTSPSVWSLDLWDGNKNTKIQFTLTTPSTRWASDVIEEVVSGVIIDDLGSYSVDIIRQETTPKVPADRPGWRVETLHDFAPSTVPFSTFGQKFFVSSDEVFLYGQDNATSLIARYDMRDWSADLEWPHLLTGSLAVNAEFFGMGVDGSLFATCEDSNRCIQIAADGSSYRTVFRPADDGRQIFARNAYVSDSYIYWLYTNRVYRTGISDGVTVDTLFFRDEINFPWGFNSIDQNIMGYDSWTVSPDDTIWFALDGPGDDDLWLNQCVARVTGADGSSNYEVTLIRVQALIDAFETGFSQSFAEPWYTDRDGGLVFPQVLFNGYGTPDVPTDEDASWILYMLPNGFTYRVAGSWDWFGNNPPPVSTATNIANGGIRDSLLRDAWRNYGHNPARTNFYFVDSGTINRGLLRVVRKQERGTVVAADHQQIVHVSVPRVVLPDATVTLTPFEGLPPF